MSARSLLPGPERSVARGVCAFLSLSVPLVVTALRVGIAPEWRDDVALVQGLGFVPVGGEGVPSALLSQVATLLPLGGRVLRAGLASALGVGIAAWALYGLALALLDQGGRAPRLSPLLALAASLTAVLSPTFQHEGTATGGATLAVGLALAALLACERSNPDDARAALGLGMLVGLALAESRLAAGAAVLALVVRGLAAGALPERRALGLGALGLAVVAGFCAVPLFVRPLAEHTWVTLGIDLSPHAVLATDVVLSSASPVVAFATELGPLSFALGVAGVISGLVRKEVRARTASLLSLAASSALLVTRGPSVLAASPVAALTLLGVASLAVLAVLGVQSVALLLSRAKIPLAGPAAVLLVVFHFTLVFAAAESSSGIVTETTGLGADVWTDEALGELPTGSLLIVRSPTLAFRLWAARVTRGERPDLVVVPLSLVGRGDVARRLVEDEPALAPLLRDVAMTGRTSEYALSALADARPLFVELDPEWDKRLLDHLRPTPLWLGFTPHTLGRSDRGIALSEDAGRRAFRRVLSVARGVPGGDAGTLAVLSAQAREQAVVLATLGDKESARRVLSDIARIEPGSSFAAKVEERLRRRGVFDPRALLE